MQGFILVVVHVNIGGVGILRAEILSDRRTMTRERPSRGGGAGVIRDE